MKLVRQLMVALSLSCAFLSVAAEAKKPSAPQASSEGASLPGDVAGNAKNIVGKWLNEAEGMGFEFKANNVLILFSKHQGPVGDAKWQISQPGVLVMTAPQGDTITVNISRRGKNLVMAKDGQTTELVPSN